MNRDDFKERLDKELEGLRFSGDAERKVLDAVGKYRWKLKALMNREIRIPVKPLAAALLIAATVTAYVVAGVTRVSAEDVQKSRIVVVENDNGRIEK